MRRAKLQLNVRNVIETDIMPKNVEQQEQTARPKLPNRRERIGLEY